MQKGDPDMFICIVDDSRVVRDLVKKALRMYNYENIIEAEDGVDALEKIKGRIQEIALYVLDVNMPRMDGLTLIEEIRKLDAKTPIIMLTTEVDKGKIMQAKEKGATGWVVKPFETEKFMKVVNMLLRK